MTAQFSEKLIYQGEEHRLFSNPLEDYFALGGYNPGLTSFCTALWRGYVGTWEIVDGRLYLTELDGKLEDHSDADLSTVFPDYPERVFAHWFTGKMRIPQGEQLEYVHMGYGSTYERDLILTFEQGVLKAEEVIDNNV
jgi:hypothetical protein